MTYSGVISNISSFDYQGKKLWSFQLNSERGVYYRCGAVAPKAEQGNYVTFEGNPGKNGSVNVDTKTLIAKAGDTSATGISAAALGSGNRKNVEEGTLDPENDRRYQSKAERDRKDSRIERQACRNTGLEFIKLLVSTDSLKIPAKNK